MKIIGELGEHDLHAAFADEPDEFLQLEVRPFLAVADAVAMMPQP